MQGNKKQKKKPSKEPTHKQEEPTLSINFKTEYHPDEVGFHYLGMNTTWKSLFRHLLYVWHAWRARNHNCKLLRNMCMYKWNNQG